MKSTTALAIATVCLPTICYAQSKLVNPDNFTRAESDLYFGNTVASGGFGKFDHTREPAPLDKQTVIRLNRDTIYSSAVFDLDAAPVTITMPDAGDRYMSMHIIDQDQYTYNIVYEPGPFTLTRDSVGTRYVIIGTRTLVDPNDPADVAKAHALQDAIKVQQERAGTFEIPDWDSKSRNKVRAALLELASTMPDTKKMYGSREQTGPVRFLIGAAQGWGGLPETAALYLNVVPEHNDGNTVYRLEVDADDVPVEGFWSVRVYNSEGYFQKNDFNSYTLNNITAKRSDGSKVRIQFGGCNADIPNCIPTPKNWNYMVRLYRPSPEIISGNWSFPKAEAVK